MKRFLVLNSYFLIALNSILLLFVIMESKLSIPAIMSPLGRMHPLLLHIPIGLIVVLLLFFFVRKEIEAKSYQTISLFLVQLLALSSSLTALMGLLLAQEEGYEGETLLWHKWSGLLFNLLVLIYLWRYPKLTIARQQIMASVLLVATFFTGHFGATITHGDNYLLGKLQTNTATFDPNKPFYEVAIRPVLEQKCMSCHNDKKKKGNLDMSTISAILKGGKGGAIWVAKQPEKSTLIERINLPLNDKKHMSPAGKPQLTDQEIQLLTAWIKEGADTKTTWNAFAANSEAKQIAQKLQGNSNETTTQKVYDFSGASKSTIEAINTPFCTVVPLATNSPALQADFYVSKNFDNNSLKNLSKVKEQLVLLNLSKMPVKDDVFGTISEFPNLEKINLSNTDITGVGIEKLTNLKHLQSIAVANTKISAENLSKLFTSKSLQEVFVWNTSLSPKIVADLSKKYPHIKFDVGYIPSETEVLKLNPPILVNEQTVLSNTMPIQLKHPLKNVTIRYTTDGTDPDSVKSPVYSKPIYINQFTELKAIATKPNWYASSKVSFAFFKLGIKPDSVNLLTKPNEAYQAMGAKSLIDTKKGDITNFKENTWLGFKENPLIANLYFNQPQKISTITLSCGVNIGSYIMPPLSIEVWGGQQENALTLLKKVSPTQPTNYEANRIVGLNLPIAPANYKVIKLIVRPISKLPTWHQGKGDKGWVFVDEIFLNE